MNCESTSVSHPVYTVIERNTRPIFLLSDSIFVRVRANDEDSLCRYLYSIILDSTYQIVARVRAMAALVRLSARMEAHVSLQMRSDLSTKSASSVWTGAKIRFRGVLRSVVACTVAGK